MKTNSWYNIGDSFDILGKDEAILNYQGKTGIIKGSDSLQSIPILIPPSIGLGSYGVDSTINAIDNTNKVINGLTPSTQTFFKFGLGTFAFLLILIGIIALVWQPLTGTVKVATKAATKAALA